MSTTTFGCNKDSSVITTFDGDSGYDLHHPIGRWQPAAYTSRVLLRFAINLAGMTAITSARVYLRHTQTHTAYSEAYAANIKPYRKTADWSENNRGENTWGGSGGSAWVTGSYADDGDAATSVPVTHTIGTWQSVDVTKIVQAWLAGASNYGILLVDASSESNSAYSKEWGSRHLSGYEPYLWVQYETNSAPNAPTLTSPATGAILTDTTPTLQFTHSDPDGDACASYDIQVDDTTGNGVEPTWGAPVWSVSGQTSGISGNTITRDVGTALNRGWWYAWRARTTDPGGLTGAWSSPRYFKINSLPTVTPVTPGSNKIAYVHNMADAAIWTLGGAYPKPRFTFTASDADGDAITEYVLSIWAASSGGSPLNGGGAGEDVTGSWASGTTIQRDSSWAGVQGTTYYWSVRVKDAHGEWSSESSRTAFKMRVGQAIYQANPGAGSGSWQVTPTWSNPQGYSSFLYRSWDGGSNYSSWYSSVGSVPIQAYLQILVRLCPTADGGSPYLGALTFTYLGSATQPDRWHMYPSADWSLDPSVRRFGTQALKCTVNPATSGDRWIYPFAAGDDGSDDVKVLPNTVMTLSAWVKIQGTLTGGVLGLAVYPAGSLVNPYVLHPAEADVTDTSAYPEGWQRIAATFTVPDGVYAIRPMLHYLYSASSSDVFWIDAVKLEEGTVATAWTPGFVGNPIVLDSNGLQVDAAAGGILRLRGSSGGVRDIIDLYDHGLLFGGDTPLDSPAAGVLRIPDVGNDLPELRIGDDVALFDADVSHMLGLKSQSTPANGGLVFGSGKDTNLYRYAANVLMTDDDMVVAAYHRLRSYDSNGALGIVDPTAGTARKLRARGIYLGTNYGEGAAPDEGIAFGADVNLYRYAANVLRTEDNLWSANLPWQVAAGRVNVTITAGGTVGYTDFSFPFTFAQVPVVLVTQDSLPGGTGNWIAKTLVSSTSTTGGRIYCYLATGTQASTATAEVAWLAFCKTPSSAEG